MPRNNVLRVTVGNTALEYTTAPLYQYDTGIVLKIAGIQLPTGYQVQFSNEPYGTSTTSIGTENGVSIPSTYLESGSDVYAWLYLHTGENDSETALMIKIPVIPRAAITDEEPTTEEQSEIDELIIALNAAVDAAEDAQDAAEAAQAAAEDAQDAIENLGVSASTLAAGSSATVTKSVDSGTGAVTLAFGIPKGDKGDQGDPGNYTKPSGGIPSSDMTSAVQTSLGKADTAYQKPGTGIPAADLASGVLTSIIDDTAGDGATGKTWSADKIYDTTSSLLNGLTAKLDKPSTAGTANQVLVSDGNGGQVWGSIGSGEITVDNTLSVSGAAADAAKTGEIKSAINADVTALISSTYTLTEITPFATPSGWRLVKDSGLCTSDSNYQLLKYQVVAGTTVVIYSDDMFQFQNGASVPSSGQSNRVGMTYGTGVYAIIVPTEATYLVISTPTTSTANAYDATSKTDKSSADISELAESVELFTKDTIYRFTKGAYIKSDYDVGDTAVLTPVPENGYEYITIDCNADESFMRIAWGGSTARQFMFVDSDNKVLSVATTYAESNTYQKIVAPANASKLIINSRLSKGNAKVYKFPTIAEKVDALQSADGEVMKATNTATSGSAFDKRSSFYLNPATLAGKTVKIRYECTASMFPNGLYWMSGNGKYLSGSAQLYLPNTDYEVKVGNSFSTSGNYYSGLYGTSDMVSGSGSVDVFFYVEFEDSRGFTQYQIDTINEFVPVPNVDLLSWGDSLTAGAGGNGTTYPAVCASELNIGALNCGVGGETGNTIAARQGGNSVVIPAGAINGTYSSLTDIYGTEIAPLLQGSGNGSASKIFINGDECTISYTSSTYTISGYTKGTSAVPLLGRFAGSSFHGKIVTIWCGANGSRIGSDTGVTARIAIINSMIRNIGHDHFVVFANWKSNGVESDFTEDDAAMLKEYGNKFFPVRKMLVNYGLTLMNITPTAQDTADIAAGTIPTSLRSDSVHLNADGYTAVGKFLADKIRSLGYV